MPIFALDENLIFPHPVLREPDGLLAVGGDLSPERLLLAYRWGIFPWYSEGQPILWYWSCPRPMIRTDKVHISHSIRNAVNQKHF
jgi:leucyl/phenylalanyl-tRNA--protein transferase